MSAFAARATSSPRHERAPFPQRSTPRGDANGANNAKREFGSPEYIAANRNEAQDLSLVTFRPRVRGFEAELRALPGVADAEAEARQWFADFVARRAERQSE